MNDLPPDVNCLEAYNIEMTQLDKYPGETQVEVKVQDHQGADTIKQVTIECPDIFKGVIELKYYTKETENIGVYNARIPEYYETEEGVYRALIRSVDSQTDENLGAIDAWDIEKLEIVHNGEGWIRNWGGYSSNSNELGENAYRITLKDVTIDDEGYIYIIGDFNGIIDLDPGEGEDYHENDLSWDNKSGYMCKYDPNGKYIWGRSWGNSRIGVKSIAINKNKQLMLCGYTPKYIGGGYRPRTGRRFLGWVFSFNI